MFTLGNALDEKTFFFFFLLFLSLLMCDSNMQNVKALTFLTDWKRCHLVSGWIICSCHSVYLIEMTAGWSFKHSYGSDH